MRRKLGADCVPIERHSKQYLVVQLHLFFDLLHHGRLNYGGPSNIDCGTLSPKLLAQGNRHALINLDAEDIHCSP